jgi:hypothetical protein
MPKKNLLVLGDSDAISWKLRTHLHSTIWLGIGAKLGDQVSTHTWRQAERISASHLLVILFLEGLNA